MYQGLPEKSLTLLVGQEHTFKSSLAVLTAKSALDKGFKPVIIDTEGGITKEFAARWGLDVEKCLYVYSPWAEEIKGVLAQIKETEERDWCIIIDSIGGIDKMKSYNDALGGLYKQDMGGNARIIKSTLKLLVNILKAQNSIGVVTSHFYSSSGLIPMPDSVVGGKSVLLLPDVILYLKKAGKKDTDIAGSDKLINISAIKNRFYPSAKSGRVSIDYVNGVDTMIGMLDIALEMDIVQKAGSWYSIDGDKIGQGATNSLEAITNNDDLRTDILNQINDKLKLTGYSTAQDEKMKESIEKLENDLLDK